MWGIGVATQKVNLNQVPLGRDTNSLVLRHDGSVYHNNEEKNRLPANNLPQEGDIVVSALFILPSLVFGTFFGKQPVSTVTQMISCRVIVLFKWLLSLSIVFN